MLALPLITRKELIMFYVFFASLMEIAPPRHESAETTIIRARLECLVDTLIAMNASRFSPASYAIFT